MSDPTVYIVLGDSACAFDERGEVVEALREGDTWDWANAGICDHRGGGGAEGYQALYKALRYAEANASMIGMDIERVA